MLLSDKRNRRIVFFGWVISYDCIHYKEIKDIILLHYFVLRYYGKDNKLVSNEIV